jgi:hypothetical protein
MGSTANPMSFAAMEANRDGRITLRPEGSYVRLRADDVRVRVRRFDGDFAFRFTFRFTWSGSRLPPVSRFHSS